MAADGGSTPRSDGSPSASSDQPDRDGEVTPAQPSEQDREALGRSATDTSGEDGREPPPVAEPVPESASVRSGGLQVALGSMKAVTLDDSVPGELAGESTSVDIEVRNESQEPISLANAFAQATQGGGRPAVERDGRRGGDFASALEPGQSRVLTFVFAASPDQLARVAFGYAPDQTLTQFEVQS